MEAPTPYQSPVATGFAGPLSDKAKDLLSSFEQSGIVRHYEA